MLVYVCAHILILFLFTGLIPVSPGSQRYIQATAQHLIRLSLNVCLNVCLILYILAVDKGISRWKKMQ